MTDTEVFAVPVKYMVVKAVIGYKVIDTSLEGRGKRVKWFISLDHAHFYAMVINELEGYHYGY